MTNPSQEIKIQFCEAVTVKSRIKKHAYTHTDGVSLIHPWKPLSMPNSIATPVIATHYLFKLTWNTKTGPKCYIKAISFYLCPSELIRIA